MIIRDVLLRLSVLLLTNGMLIGNAYVIVTCTAFPAVLQALPLRSLVVHCEFQVVVEYAPVPGPTDPLHQLAFTVMLLGLRPVKAWLRTHVWRLVPPFVEVGLLPVVGERLQFGNVDETIHEYPPRTDA